MTTLTSILAACFITFFALIPLVALAAMFRAAQRHHETSRAVRAVTIEHGPSTLSPVALGA